MADSISVALKYFVSLLLRLHGMASIIVPVKLAPSSTNTYLIA